VSLFFFGYSLCSCVCVHNWKYLCVCVCVCVCTNANTSGLNLAPVSRLRGTWEKLPAKYDKLLSELQTVFDPSRNMAKYRSLLNTPTHTLQPPVIPLFPCLWGSQEATAAV